MKANQVFNLDSHVGPMSSKVNLVLERDLGRIGIFAIETLTMVQFPVKSYGKVKKSYAIVVYEYHKDENGELYPSPVDTVHFKNKTDLKRAFKTYQLG